MVKASGLTDVRITYQLGCRVVRSCLEVYWVLRSIPTSHRECMEYAIVFTYTRRDERYNLRRFPKPIKLNNADRT